MPEDSSRELATVAKFSPDGRYVAVGTVQGTVKILDANDMSLLSSGITHLRGVNDVSWSRDQRYIVSAGDDCLVIIWKYEGNEALKPTRILYGHRAAVTSAQMNVKGTLIVSTGVDQTVRLWDAVEGRCFRTLNAHSEPVNSCDISYDGSTAVSASGDGSIRLWNVSTGRCLRSIPVSDKREPLTIATFTPNSQYVAVRSNHNEIFLMDFIDQRCVKRYSYEAAPDGLTRGIVFWKHYILCGTSIGVLIWDINTRDRLEKAIVDGPVLSLDRFEDTLICTRPNGEIQKTDLLSLISS